jgi:DNA-directed RNA polymerase specialized sigma24 family protein
LTFRKKSESQLNTLSDDELVAYLVAARDSGHDDEVRLATSILVFGRWDQQLALVLTKIDSYEDAEDITGVVMMQTIEAAFDGTHTGQFFSLMNVIRKARIADYYAKKERTPDQGHGDDDELIEKLFADGSLEDEVTTRMLLDQILEGESERDRYIVGKRIEGHPSNEVAEMVNSRGKSGDGEMTGTNVDQIFSRFRKKARSFFFPEGQEK